MANIKVNELNPVGAELFLDSDSFLNELSESEELIQILGGNHPTGKPCFLTIDPVFCELTINVGC
ncbi:MAG: hypothetical protein QNJ47_00735 [Nostocaceae cyanobacterium]|nr:hypothetical protein [Nostocaceae cyanobacterium]